MGENVMDDLKSSYPVCLAGEFCIPAAIVSELREKIDTLTARNKELHEAIATVAKLPHTCSAIIGPSQCPPCAVHLYVYSRDKSENIAAANNRIAAINTSIRDGLCVDRIATELSGDLLFNNGSSFWHRRIKQELQRAYDSGEAQNTRLRAMLHAAQALLEALKAAGVQ
jgi:hypothetical protein